MSSNFGVQSPYHLTSLQLDTVFTYDKLCRFKEFVKEQLVSIPTISGAPSPAPPQTQPTIAPTSLSDPGTMLAGLLH